MKRLVFCVLIFFCQLTSLLAQAPGFRWAERGYGTTKRNPSDLGDNYSYALAVDASGNSYVTGYFSMLDFTFGSTVLHDSAFADVFVAKYDSGGNVAWATSIGGAGADVGYGIAVDSAGNSFIAGFYTSPVIVVGSDTLRNPGGSTLRVLVVKYDPSGNPLWARSSQSGAGIAYGVATDAFGNCIVTGRFSGGPMTFGSTTLTNAGGADVFVVKIDPSGNVLWARGAGGSGDDEGTCVAVDPSGNCTVAGNFASTGLGIGPWFLSNTGFHSIFILRYSAAGEILYGNTARGPVRAQVSGVTVDALGNSFITGSFSSDVIIFGNDTLENDHTGYLDAFVAKFNASCTPLWAQSAGGINDEVGYSIAVDPAGNVCSAGYFAGPSISFGPITLSRTGDHAADKLYAVKYGPQGNVVWAESFGGGASDVWGLGVDPTGNIYASGSYAGAPAVFGADTLASSGTIDVYLAKLDGSLPVLTGVRDVPGDQGGVVTVHWSPAGSDNSRVYGVTSYSVWRTAQTNAAPRQKSNTGSFVPRKTIVRRNASGATTLWEQVGVQSTTMLSEYALDVPTLADSVAADSSGEESFFVRAETGDSTQFFDSNIGPGYSVDNIPPNIPSGVQATGQSGPKVQLTWYPNGDPDFSHYELFRSNTPGFVPTPILLLASVSATGYLDSTCTMGSGYFYRVVAVDVHGNQSTASAEVGASFPVDVACSIVPSWNIVSLPLLTADSAVSALFPTAVSDAFAYNVEYVPSPSLHAGKGYWLRFSGAQSVPFHGLTLPADTIDVVAGWNLIGGGSTPIPDSEITSIPGGLVASPLFGYDFGYMPSLVLEPGKGYWIKMNAGGKLVLRASSAAATRIKIVATTERPPAPPDGEGRPMPKEYLLHQNYPNPFNPTTSIQYDLPAPSRVTITVYSLLGEAVEDLVNADQDAGYKEIVWNAAGCASGVYFCRMDAVRSSDPAIRFTSVRKMLVIK